MDEAVERGIRRHQAEEWDDVLEQSCQPRDRLCTPYLAVLRGSSHYLSEWEPEAFHIEVIQLQSSRIVQDGVRKGSEKEMLQVLDRRNQDSTAERVYGPAPTLRLLSLFAA